MSSQLIAGEPTYYPPIREREQLSEREGGREREGEREGSREGGI